MNEINEVLPIKGIVLLDESTDTKLTLEPMNDITVFELTHLLVLLTTMHVPRPWDFLSYIKEKGLERHFTTENDDTPVADR